MVLAEKIKNFSPDELQAIARQLRVNIIDACSVCGGHIGASLGAVELTIALHTEFCTPSDSIVWDVGHQSYAHKLLTGRSELVTKLRMSNGPSGFTSRAESEHDAFGAGHSSTSISAALGIAEAKRLNHDATWTIAVIGDGGLTSGLAFEALNQAGASAEPRLIIVVNDNNLSISPNVGAIDRWVFGAERDPQKFFNSLGFNYVGPIDGHDISTLRKCFKTIKSGPLDRVSVVHVRTVKGKGYAPAENDPVRFHGVGPFDKITGLSEAKKGGLTYSQVFANKLVEIATKDERIVALTAAMSEGTALNLYQKKYPERFYDVGIAEAHCLVFAAGLSTKNIKPVCVIYSTFLQRAVDSIIHDTALQQLDVVLGIDRAGLVGADGPTHQGVFDIALLRAIPNVTIAAPASKNDLDVILEEAVSKKGVKAIRYPRGPATIETKYQHTAWGRARQLTPNGAIVVWALGEALNWTVEALAILNESEREKICVVDARFAKPIDVELLKNTVTNAKVLLTIEDGCVAGGFGSAVLEQIVACGISLPGKVELLGVPDRFVPHAEVSEQREMFGLSANKLANTLRTAILKNV